MNTNSLTEDIQSMDLYLPISITTPIYFYVGWNELSQYPGVSNDVWNRLRDDMCQDPQFRVGYDAYNAVCQIKSGVKDKLLYFINYLLNQSENEIPKIMQRNKDFIRQYTQYNDISDIEWIQKDLCSDRVIMQNIIYGNAKWEWLCESLRDNEEFLITVIGYTPEIFQYIDAKWKSNEDFLLKAIASNACVFEYYDELRKSDATFILKALQIDDGFWYAVAESCKSDWSFVSQSIKVNYRITADAELWDRYPVLLGHIVEQNDDMIKYIFEDCKYDPDVKAMCIRICTINPKILLRAIRLCGISALECLTSSFGKDEQFVLELLRITTCYDDIRRRFVASCIDPELKSNPEFLMKALRINSHLWTRFFNSTNEDVKKLSQGYGRAEWRLGPGY